MVLMLDGTPSASTVQRAQIWQHYFATKVFIDAQVLKVEDIAVTTRTRQMERWNDPLFATEEADIYFCASVQFLEMLPENKCGETTGGIWTPS